MLPAKTASREKIKPGRKIGARTSNPTSAKTQA